MDRPVKVERLAIPGDIPTDATVYEIKGGFHVFVADRLQGPVLMGNILHEFRHAMLGHAPEPPFSLGLERKTLLGFEDPMTKLRRQAYQPNGPEKKAVEDEIDRWALVETRRWWPILERGFRTIAANSGVS